jgi:hypothetical protein
MTDSLTTHCDALGIYAESRGGLVKVIDDLAHCRRYIGIRDQEPTKATLPLSN